MNPKKFWELYKKQLSVIIMILYAFMTILHTGRDAVSQQRVWAVGRAPGLVRSALCSAEASTGGRRHQQAVGGVRE